MQPVIQTGATEDNNQCCRAGCKVIADNRTVISHSEVHSNKVAPDQGYFRVLKAPMKRKCYFDETSTTGCTRSSHLGNF